MGLCLIFFDRSSIRRKSAKIVSFFFQNVLEHSMVNIKLGGKDVEALHDECTIYPKDIEEISEKIVKQIHTQLRSFP